MRLPGRASRLHLLRTCDGRATGDQTHQEYNLKTTLVLGHNCYQGGQQVAASAAGHRRFDPGLLETDPRTGEDHKINIPEDLSRCRRVDYLGPESPVPSPALICRRLGQISSGIRRPRRPYMACRLPSNQIDHALRPASYWASTNRQFPSAGQRRRPGYPDGDPPRSPPGHHIVRGRWSANSQDRKLKQLCDTIPNSDLPMNMPSIVITWQAAGARFGCLFVQF